MKNMVTWQGGNFAQKKDGAAGHLRGNFFLPYFVLDVRASPPSPGGGFSFFLFVRSLRQCQREEVRAVLLDLGAFVWQLEGDDSIRQRCA